MTQSQLCPQILQTWTNSHFPSDKQIHGFLSGEVQRAWEMLLPLAPEQL